MKRTMIALLGTLAVAAAACTDDASDSAPEPAQTSTRPTETSAAAMTPSLPDTTAAAVWAMLTEADFRDSWTLWPGLGELYSGNEPHGMLLTTYLNDIALEALESQAGSMPVGAVLVKDNFMPDSTLAATTVMLKRETSYNPEHNGWWWLKRNADGTNEVVGRGAGCQSCHGGQAADNDYVVTGSLSGGQ